MKKFKLSELAEMFDGKIIGDENLEITGISGLDYASETEIVYLDNMKFAKRVNECKSPAVIVEQEITDTEKTQLVVKRVAAVVIEMLKIYAPKLMPAKAGVDTSAIVDESAEIAESASICAGAVIKPNVKISENCVIGENVVVGENTVIGNDTVLDSGVVVYHNCKIGESCLIQANSVIGSIGFGYDYIDGEHRLIPHNKGVTIEDCVHIGAGCCIDRGKFEDTLIGAGTKIDNLVQIAHGVILGKLCLIAGGCGLAGSAVIEDGVVLAGQVGVANHIKIGSLSRVGAQSGVITNINPKSEVAGTPAINVKDMLRQILVVQKLPEMAKTIKELEKKVKKLESAEND